LVGSEKKSSHARAASWFFEFEATASWSSILPLSRALSAALSEPGKGM